MEKQFLLFFRGQVESEGAAQAGDALQGHVPAVELGDLLRPGENEIAVEIIGNLRNLLGPHHLEEGECYAVCPSSFFQESKVWCGGTNPAWNDDYCFVRYGLFLQDK